MSCHWKLLHVCNFYCDNFKNTNVMGMQTSEVGVCHHKNVKLVCKAERMTKLDPLYCSSRYSRLKYKLKIIFQFKF
jgi:hypothetical protein